MFVSRYEECVELLLRYGARIDAEARMCFPGTHLHNCEESGKFCKLFNTSLIITLFVTL